MAGTRIRRDGNVGTGDGPTAGGVVEDITTRAAERRLHPLALFLVSEHLSFIFGQVISNDGGWS